MMQFNSGGYSGLTNSIDFVEGIGWTLVHSIWQFACLASAAMLAGRVLQRHPSSVRYLINAGFMFLMLVATIATWVSMPQTTPATSERATEREIAAISGASNDSIAKPRSADDSDVLPASPPKIPFEPTDVPIADLTAGPLLPSSLWTRITEFIEPWLSGFVIAWICGVIAFALRPALSWYTVWRLRTVGVETVDETIQLMLHRLKRTFVVRQSVEVLQSSLVQTPIVFGCFQSVILLPLGLIANLPIVQLEAILAHELVHVKRYDYLVNLVQSMMETIFFYHPAIWWLSHRIRIERENCCDDQVVSVLGDRVQYGRALLAVEELKDARTTLALGAADGSLLSRVERISGIRKSGATPLTLGLSSTFLLTVVVMGIAWTISTVSAKTNNEGSPDFGMESHGLRCRVVGLMSTSLDHSPDISQSVDLFANSKEMTFAVELKNFSDRTISLGGVRHSSASSNSAPDGFETKLLAPLWFEFEFMDQLGKPITRTQRVFFNAEVIAFSASIHELAPGASLVVVCRPGQFIAPMNHELDSGKYQVRVRYRGLDEQCRDSIRRSSPDNPILGTWPHSVDSLPFAFSIESNTNRISTEKLVWGKTVSGLQAAIEFRGPDDVQGDPIIAPGIPIGTSIGIIFHVKNVSHEPIEFVSETGRQGDTAHVVNESGENIEIDGPFFTGWPIDVAWTLQPGEIAELNLLTPSLQSLQQPGKYKVHYTILFNSRQLKDDLGNRVFPRPGDYDKELDTGESTLFLFDSTSKESLNDATNQVPFRLPDHWIVEDVQLVNQDRELRTVSIQGGVNVRRWDMANRRLLSEIKLAADVHGQGFRQETLRLSADGSRVLAATDDYVGVWDSLTGELLKRLQIPKQQSAHDCVRCLDCSADGSLVVAGLGTSFDRTTLVYDGYGIVWNVASEEVVSRSTHRHGYYFADVALSNDGTRYASCSEHGGGVCIWETSSGKLLHDLTAEIGNWKSPNIELFTNNLVNAITFTPDDQILAVSGTFGVKLFETSSGRHLRTIDAPYRYSNGSTEICFSSDGRQFARMGASGPTPGYSVLIFATESGQVLFELKSDASSGTFSQDGKLFAAAESDFFEAISVWPLEGKKLKSLAEPIPYSRINRVEENTHVLGDDAQAYVDKWRPSWGQAQQGVEYGIALTTSSDTFRSGQQLFLAAFVRNVSNEPKHIALMPDMFGNVPMLTNASGEIMPLETRPLLGNRAHYRETLQPGECFGPLYFNIGIGANPRPSAQVWEPFWRSATLGRFKLVHKTDIHIAEQSVDRNSNLDSPGWSKGTLVSNAIDFEVVETEQESEEPTDSQSDALPFEAGDVNESLNLSDPTITLPDSLNVMAVGFSRDIEKLWSVSTGSDVRIRTWSLGAKKMTQDIKLDSDQHGNMFLSSELTLLPNSTRVVGILSGEVGVWDSTSGGLLKWLKLPTELQHGMLRGLSVSGNSKRVACGRNSGLGGRVNPDCLGVVWDIETGEVVQTVVHEEAVQIQSTALSFDGERLATGSQNATLYLWDISNGDRLFSYKNDNFGRKHSDLEVSIEGASQILGLAFSPDDRQLAMADMLGVKAFETASWKLEYSIASTFRFGRSGLVYSMDGRLLARIGTDKTVPIWETKQGQPVAELLTESNAGSFSFDGKWFAAGFSDNTQGIRLWRLPKE